MSARGDLVAEPEHVTLRRLLQVGQPAAHEFRTIVRGARITSGGPNGQRYIKGGLPEFPLEESMKKRSQSTDQLTRFSCVKACLRPGEKTVRRASSRDTLWWPGRHDPRVDLCHEGLLPAKRGTQG